MVNDTYSCATGWLLDGGSTERLPHWRPSRQWHPGVVAKRLFINLIVVVVCGASIPSQAGAIDFEDGTGHDSPIPNNWYPGLTLTNAVWISDPQFHNGNFGLGVDLGKISSEDWQFPGTDSPIIIQFDVPVSETSIVAFDVGANGAQIEAFDSDGKSIGVDNITGTGFGIGHNGILSIMGDNISRIELTQHLFQPNTQPPSDGVGWDNLVFTTVPEPTSLGFFCISFVAFLRISTSARCPFAWG